MDLNRLSSYPGTDARSRLLQNLPRWRSGRSALSKGSRLLVLTAAGCFMAFFLVALCLPGGLQLTVAPLKGGPPLLILPLQAGERFTLHYYHSVENAPIWEVHSLDRKGRIYIEEERYLKFGAGMGKMPGVGRLVQKGPYEAIVDMHLPTGDFVLRVGSRGVDHTVIYRDTRVNLSLVAPHRAVRFSAQPISLLHGWWRHFFPHPATPLLEKD